jgi:hypothetical protein
MPRNTGVFEPTFHGKGPVRSDDILKDARYGKNAPYYGMPKGHLPVRSYLAVPIDNARLHQKSQLAEQELQRINQTLAQRVEERARQLAASQVTMCSLGSSMKIA